MRPDPYKKKASRKYWAKQKSKSDTSSTTDQNKPSEPQQLHSEHTQPAPPNDTQVADTQQPPDLQSTDTQQAVDEANTSNEREEEHDNSNKPARAQYSRRRLQDNSWRYVEETEVDEEAMINARIAAAEEQKDLQEIVSHIKAKKLDISEHSDNVLVRPREELDPLDSVERNRILNELNAEIVFDEFTPNTLPAPANNTVVRSDYVKISLDELAPSAKPTSQSMSNKTDQLKAADAKKHAESDELDKLLDDLL
ncbi:hypothetical protein FB645_003712 [Coemansia sp. IMI 203386]|nr:hypothetical protein FB645_003712 [Coemansia sp. IMI 203386]